MLYQLRYLTFGEEEFLELLILVEHGSLWDGGAEVRDVLTACDGHSVCISIIGEGRGGGERERMSVGGGGGERERVCVGGEGGGERERVCVGGGGGGGGERLE